MTKREASESLATALSEWRDAGGPVEAVVVAIRQLEESTQDDPPEIQPGELHLCPQRELDAARATIKELEGDLEYEKQQHGITSAGTDVLVKLAIERCAGVVKAHSEHMYGCYTELDADTDEADRLLADISMLDDITREIRALPAKGGSDE